MPKPISYTMPSKSSGTTKPRVILMSGRIICSSAVANTSSAWNLPAWVKPFAGIFITAIPRSLSLGTVYHILKQGTIKPRNMEFSSLSRGCSLASGHFLFRAVFVTARVGVLVTAVVGFTAGERFGFSVRAVVVGSPSASTSASSFCTLALTGSFTASTSE